MNTTSQVIGKKKKKSLEKFTTLSFSGLPTIQFFRNLNLIFTNFLIKNLVKKIPKNKEFIFYTILTCLFSLLRVVSSHYLFEETIISVLNLEINQSNCVSTVAMDTIIFIITNLISILIVEAWFVYRQRLQKNHIILVGFIFSIFLFYSIAANIFNTSEKIFFVNFLSTKENLGNKISSVSLVLNYLFFHVMSCVLFSGLTHHNDFLVDSIFTNITQNFELREGLKMGLGVLNVSSEIIIFIILKLTKFWSFELGLSAFFLSHVLSSILNSKLQYDSIIQLEPETKPEKSVVVSEDSEKKIYSLAIFLEKNYRLLWPFLMSLLTYLGCVYTATLSKNINQVIAALTHQVMFKPLNYLEQTTRIGLFSINEFILNNSKKLFSRIGTAIFFMYIDGFLFKMFSLVYSEEDAKKLSVKLKAKIIVTAQIVIPIFFLKSFLIYRRAHYTLFTKEVINNKRELLKAYNSFKLIFEKERFNFATWNNIRMGLNNLAFLACSFSSKSYSKTIQEKLELFFKILFLDSFKVYYIPHNLPITIHIFPLLSILHFMSACCCADAAYKKMTNPKGYPNI